MNILVYICIGTVLCVVLVFFVYRLLIARSHSAEQKPRPTPPPKEASSVITPAAKTQWQPQTLTIGILTPLPNEAALFLTQGITQSVRMSTNVKYVVSSLAGDNTRVHLFEMATEALKTCDILVTYGVTCANIVAEACVVAGPVPIINLGLRPSQYQKLSRTVDPTLVITSEYNYPPQARLFKQLKPHAQNVCIMYRTHHEASSEEVAALSAALEEVGLSVTTHVLTHNTHIDNQMSALHKTYDTLFLMPGTVVSKNVQELITYCNSKHITLCAQELDLVILGAALGFGGHEKELGTQCGYHIRNIFESKKKYAPRTVISHVPRYYCTINKSKYEIQDVALSTEYVMLLEHTLLINQPVMTTSAPDISPPHHPL